MHHARISVNLNRLVLTTRPEINQAEPTRAKTTPAKTIRAVAPQSKTMRIRFYGSCNCLFF